jgi:hypothetical protein
VHQRHQVLQEIRGSEVEGPAVSFSPLTRRSMEAPPSPLSSREPVTFSIFRVFYSTNRRFFNPPQSRHPERSAARICRITDALWRGVEEPVPSVAEGTQAMIVGRCSSKLSSHKIQSKSKKSQAPSEAEGSAVLRSLFNSLPLRTRKLHLCSGHILLQVLHRRSSRNRNQHR